MSIKVRDFQAVMQNTTSQDVVLSTLATDTEVEIARIEFARIKRGDSIELKGELRLHCEEDHPFELETKIYRIDSTAQTNKELYRLHETLGHEPTPSTSATFLYFIDQITENHAKVVYTMTALIRSDDIEQVDVKLPLSFAGTVYSPFVPKQMASFRPQRSRSRTRHPRQRR